MGRKKKFKKEMRSLERQFAIAVILFWVFLACSALAAVLKVINGFCSLCN